MYRQGEREGERGKGRGKGKGIPEAELSSVAEPRSPKVPMQTVPLSSWMNCRI